MGPIGGLLTMRRHRIAALAAVATIAGTLTLGAAAPAQAVVGGLELSADGVSWGSSLSTPVFPAGQALVPGSRINGTFFVRNATDQAAWLRVGVSDLTVTSLDFAVAMNLSAVGTTADGASGSSSKVGAADIVCSDLLGRDTPLPAGGAVRVDTSLWFRPDVTGKTAQNEAAQVAFIAELSEVDLNALGSPLCTNSMVVGPVDPSSGGGTGGGSGGSAGTGPAAPGSGAGGTGASGSAGAGGQAGAGGTDPVGIATSGSIPGGWIDFGWGGPRPFAELDTDLGFNTVQWWEEYAIFVLIGAAVAGAFARIYVQRRWVIADRRTGVSEWQGTERPIPAPVRRASGRTLPPESARAYSSSL